MKKKRSDNHKPIQSTARADAPQRAEIVRCADENGAAEGVGCGANVDVDDEVGMDAGQGGDSVADVTVVLLAKTLCDIYEQINADGVAVQQDASLPSSARRALALLSGLCLTSEHNEDLGASIHTVMDLACRPLGEWGLGAFDDGARRYAHITLIDRDLSVPTEDCRELARAGGSEVAALEEIHHETLRQVVKDYPPLERNAAYTAIRELVVRNPIIHVDELHGFIVTGGHTSSARTIMSFYRPISQAAYHGDVCHRCAYCGGLLWPDRARDLYPVGRCRIRQCRLANPTPATKDNIPDPHHWRIGTNAAIGFWVGPGLDEIKIYDALTGAGRNAVLYPHQDAADVGVDGLDIGVDVKTYASPIVLGSKLSRSIGNLDIFARRILAVPDDKLRSNPRYLDQLRGSYQGSTYLEFMTVSQAIRVLSRKGASAI